MTSPARVVFVDALALAIACSVAVGVPSVVSAQRGGKAGAPAASDVKQADAAGGSAQAAGPEMSFSTRVDKTALWIGDRFHYQITVDHPPMIQFVMDNVNKEAINLDPFRVIDVNASTTRLKDGSERLFVDLTLANLSAGTGDVPIPQFTLFYFRREGAAATNREGAAAEGLTIPGPVLAVRSTLPPKAPDLRDAMTVTGWPRSRWIVANLGWCALFLLVVGAGWEGAQMIKQRKGRAGPDPRKAMKAVEERWSRDVPGEFADANVLAEFYGRSYQDVKEYLRHLLDIPTDGLTADDLRDEMQRLATDPDFRERVFIVLSTCEAARYGQDRQALAADTGRRVANDVKEIFQRGSRL